MKHSLDEMEVLVRAERAVEAVRKQYADGRRGMQLARIPTDCR
jgi:hypothetical protein